MRNPAKDQVAIVGIGRSRYRRDDPQRSIAGVAADAAIAAIRDAGVDKADIDGVCGSLGVSDVEMQLALGLPDVHWGVNHRTPFGFLLIEAMNAVFAGACEVALVYHATFHGPRATRSPSLWSRSSAIGTGFAVPWKTTVGARLAPGDPGSLQGGIGYASLASRYLFEFGVTREQTLGRVAVNNRANAVSNDEAVLREPMTMDDYSSARMVREPYGLYDLDIPVTGADAFVVTTAERARDLATKPVYVHAATAGRTADCREDQMPDLHRHGQEVVSRALWAKSDLTLRDVDLFLPYDGFTLISILWLESVGYCRRGEAADFLADHWNTARNRIEIDGRVPVNTHGGNLSEGATQGSGALLEGVRQLRGTAGHRQVPGARVALWTPGGIVWNAAGALLRADSSPSTSP